MQHVLQVIHEVFAVRHCLECHMLEVEDDVRKCAPGIWSDQASFHLIWSDLKVLQRQQRQWRSVWYVFILAFTVVAGQNTPVAVCVFCQLPTWWLIERDVLGTRDLCGTGMRVSAWVTCYTCTTPTSSSYFQLTLVV